MDAKFNRAGRFLALIDAYRLTNLERDSMDVHAEIFNVNDENPAVRQDVVAQMLVDLAGELREMVRQLSDAGVPNVCFQTAVEGLRAVFATHHLRTRFVGLFSNITPVVLMSLHWVHFYLPSDPEKLSDEEVSALIAEIGEFENALLEIGLSEGLRRCLQPHLQKLKISLRQYHFCGITPLKRTLVDVAVSMEGEVPNLSREATQSGVAGKDALSTMSSLVAKAGAFADRIVRGKNTSIPVRRSPGTSPMY